MEKHKIAQLDDVELTFLSNYRPADEHTTSSAEIAEVNRQLALSSYNDPEELRAVRNAVVNLHEEGKMAFSGMLSVVSVIDRYMFRLDHESV